ncbi:RagB/SusD family nutrient uptake outer membrane protein [Sphingobacterium sp. xlx-130]|uniref:RagB/SusD family nutrient uptake outer membrane protein n=1 Tax=Sphingobacterium sp. xlx-130 TaxID=2654323 RepID=UPI0013D9E4DF|nr:RagB/SusD family nutrient uptake outer membrane protein [Sphingobacterium sp. xlx-130]
MNMFKIFANCLLILLAFCSCEKFLNVRTNNSDSINPRTVDDFEEILNNAQLAGRNYFLADLVTDDVYLTDGIVDKGGASSFYVNAYLWNDEVWGSAEDDYMYNETYKSILQVNIVVDNIMTALDGSFENKARIQAQAKIHRAYYYSQLVGIYGLDYHNISANSDLAVPLILHPDANGVFPRSTVQQVYDQILVDLNDAINTQSLPDFGVDVLHPGKAVAYGLLARVYLIMGDFQKALFNAEEALKIRDTLLDYRIFSFVNGSNASNGIQGKLITLEEQKNNPEVLLAKVVLDSDFYNKFNENLQISADLLGLYDPEDLRLVYNFEYNATNSTAKYPFHTQRYVQYTPFNYSIGVPEVMLIKAECLARSGEGADAVETVNKLRKFRFKPSDYADLEVGEDALAIVLDERRRELTLKGGLRLFDLKRLNREGKYVKTIERQGPATIEEILAGSPPIKVIKSLPPLSPRYLIPFSPKLIASNSLIIQNER